MAITKSITYYYNLYGSDVTNLVTVDESPVTPITTINANSDNVVRIKLITPIDISLTRDISFSYNNGRTSSAKSLTYGGTQEVTYSGDTDDWNVYYYDMSEVILGQVGLLVSNPFKFSGRFREQNELYYGSYDAEGDLPLIAAASDLVDRNYATVVDTSFEYDADLDSWSDLGYLKGRYIQITVTTAVTLTVVNTVVGGEVTLEASEMEILIDWLTDLELDLVTLQGQLKQSTDGAFQPADDTDWSSDKRIEEYLMGTFADKVTKDYTFASVILYNAGGNAVATYDGTDVIFAYGGKNVELAKNLFVRVKASSNIAEGDVVQYTGSIGSSGKISGKPAVQAEINAAPYLIVGVATEAIASGSEGECNFYGRVNGIDTTGYGTTTEGSVLYFDSEGSTAGAMTSTAPVAPNVQVKMAILTVHHATTGQIAIRPDTGKSLGELHDVYFNGHTFIGNEIIKYNVSTSRWEICYLSDTTPLLDEENTFTKANTFESGDNKIVIDPVTGNVKIYYEDNLYVTLTKEGMELNPTYVTSVLANRVPSKTMVDAYIETHNVGSTVHDDIRTDIETLEQDISRLDGRGKSYGEIPYLTSELQALSVSARDTAITNAVIAGNGGAGYVPESGHLVYDEGVGDGVNYHEWEFNGTNWVDNGASTSPKASNTIFGVIQGNEYIDIIAGICQVLLADNATALKDSGSALNFTYSDIVSELLLKFDVAGGTITGDTEINNSLTSSVALIVNAIASTTTSLQSWQLNGSQKAFMDVNGNLFNTSIVNISTASNAYLQMLSTGAKISRNIADANPALIVDLLNALASGNIEEWNLAGTKVAEINKLGEFVNESAIESPEHRFDSTTMIVKSTDSGETVIDFIIGD